MERLTTFTRKAPSYWGTNPMCACIPVCFQRNVIFAKARPTQMIFITTSTIYACSRYPAPEQGTYPTPK